MKSRASRKVEHDLHTSFSGEDGNTLNKVISRLSPELNLSGKVTQLDKYPIAKGGFCEIFLGRTDDSELVAIRRPRSTVHGGGATAVTVRFLFLDSTCLADAFLKRIARGVRVWAKLSDDNILVLLGFLDEKQAFPSLITPWMKNENARDYLNNNNNVDVVILVSHAMTFCLPMYV